MPGAEPTDRILVIEDADADFQLLRRHLQRQGLGAMCRRVASLAALDEAIAEGGWQVVLADHALPGFDFDALLARLRTELPAVPVILVSGTIGEELAVDLLRSGVADFVLKDRMGRLVPAIERCRDDVRRRAAAEAASRALAESEAFNRTIVRSLGDGLFIAQQGRFVYANPALPALLGLPPERLAGLRFEEVVAPGSLDLWNERFEQRTQPERAEPEGHYDVAFMHAEGHLIWMELRAARFQFKGEPAVLGLLRDLTERRRIVAELQQHRHHLEALVEERTQKAEAANRAKSSFLANMSHEIRTPLNAITGMVHLLLRDAADAQARSRLQTVDEAARHLLSLVDDVLDLSKIESGKLTLEDIDFELDALLSRAVELVADRARDKGLALRVDNRARGARLRGDPTRLSQMLLNLLGNAVKFTERGGIELQVQIDQADGPWPTLRLQVADTGIGVAAERLPQLFSAFEQGDSSTTRRYGGSGLGLAITRHLAELMHGRVGVLPQEGGGSVFWFEVRLAPAQDPQSGAASRRPADARQAEARLRQEHAGARVLLVEDNSVNQLVAGELLRGVGLQVDLADDGLQAIERAARTSYALILMDVQMPHLDGLQASRAIRRLAGGTQVPIVAMTANAFNEDRDACLAAGMNDHLSKPVMPQRLYETLLRWLGEPGLRPQAPAAPRPEAGLDAGALLAALAGVPGLLAAEGLAQFAGRAGTYRSGLAEWVRLYGRGLSENPETLRRELHSLQGASSAIGAGGLASTARALEVALAAEGGAGSADAQQRLAALQAELRRIAQALGSALGEAQAAP